MPTIVMESAGALIGIADVAFRLGTQLAKFLKEVQEANETSNAIHQQASLFRNVLSFVVRALGDGGAYSQIGLANRHESDLRRTMKDALEHCEVTVSKFEARLRKLGRGSDSGWVRNFAFALRNQAQGSGLERSEEDMKANIALLHLLLTLYSPISMYGTFRRLSSDNVEIKQYLERLEDKIKEVTYHTRSRTGLPRSSIDSASSPSQQSSPFSSGEDGHAVLRESRSHSEVVDETLSIAWDVRTTISSPDIHDRQRSSSSTMPDSPPNGLRGSRPLNQSNGAQSVGSRDLPQHRPQFQGSPRQGNVEYSPPRYPSNEFGDDDLDSVQRFIDSTDRADVRLPSTDMGMYLRGYSRRGTEHLQNEEFQEAQMQFWKAFWYGIQTQKQHGIPFPERHEVGLGLAAASLGCHNYNLAEGWLEWLIHPAVANTFKLGEIYYNKALLRHTLYLRESSQHNLNRLTDAARQSYEYSAMPPGEFLAPSMKIMYEVSRHDNDEVGMEIYWTQDPTAIEIPIFGYPRGAASHNAIPLPEFPEHHTLTPETVFSSAEKGDVETIANIIYSGVDLEQRDRSYGQTPLLIAVKCQKIGVCRLLLENRHRNADIHAQDNQGLTAMHIALRQPKSRALVELLLRHHPDIHAVDEEGYTLLHCCAKWNKPIAAHELLSMGAKVDVRDKLLNETALSLAMRKGKVDIVNCYLVAGIKIDEEHMAKATPNVRDHIRSYRYHEERREVGTNIRRQTSHSTQETHRSNWSWRDPFSRRGSASPY